MKNANINQDSAKDSQKPQKERKFPKFGVLDAVIILLVIAIVAGIYFRYSFFDTLNSMKNMKECYVTFKTDKITTNVSREMYDGDAIYFKSDGSSFGTLALKSEEITMVIQEQPATSTVFKDGKTYADVQYPQGMDGSLIYGIGTIKCNCAVSENGSYLLNGTTYISPGQTYTVCTEKVTVNIMITDIEVVS
jgi:hypothetical protein